MTVPRIMPSPREILNAYLTLFGQPHDGLMQSFINLDPEKIKAAYRVQALRHHPDRARRLGLPPKALTDRFIRIRAAYEVLQTCAGHSPLAYTIKQNGSRSSACACRSSKLPSCTMGQPLGQLLLARRIISFSTLIEAITWQRRSRPTYGELAHAMGLIGKNELKKIIEARLPREKTGDCAVRLGLLSSLTSRLILNRQARLQRPLGEFFVNRGVLTRAELDEILREISSGKENATGTGDFQKENT